jgi:hypothetical protein
MISVAGCGMERRENISAGVQVVAFSPSCYIINDVEMSYFILGRSGAVHPV